MSTFRLRSAVEQAAAFLREEIASGALRGTMPGENRLAADLRVSPKTIIAALQQLEGEGSIVGQGARRRRLIVPQRETSPRPMRIAILHYEPSDMLLSYLINLQHALTEVGHVASFAGKSLTDLKMNLDGVKRLVRGTDVDAWVVVAGSLEILEWFCEQPTPAFALFGRRTSLPMASVGPAMETGIAETTRQLIALGHHRIVHLCRSERRRPGPGKTERAFLNELSAHNIPTSDYNLPDWEETTAGIHSLLLSLFKVTPPTAVIVGDTPFFLPILQFLGSRGIRVPQDVSLVCEESDPHFAWCTPSIAHIRWDSALAVRRILRWAANASRGQHDEVQTNVPSEFVAGGTIGTAKVD